MEPNSIRGDLREKSKRKNKAHSLKPITNNYYGYGSIIGKSENHFDEYEYLTEMRAKDKETKKNLKSLQICIFPNKPMDHYGIATPFAIC